MTIIIMNKLVIKYVSDIHLELVHNPHKYIKKIKSTNNEICILAGDIGNPYKPHYKILMDHINKNFKKSFVISGNHEYYNNNRTVEETNIYMIDYFDKYKNITFLNNDYEYYENICFIGTTLWSKITNPKYKINDTCCIKNLNINAFNALHNKCLNYLDTTLNTITSDVIVITHHLPSEKLVDKKYKIGEYSNNNQWFYSDMDDLLEKYNDKIKLWFYGHTHTPGDTTVNGVRLLCNPIGYSGENFKHDFNKTIELDF